MRSLQLKLALSDLQPLGLLLGAQCPQAVPASQEEDWLCPLVPYLVERPDILSRKLQPVPLATIPRIRPRFLAWPHSSSDPLEPP